jgi:SAM-dependent methyltransferase
MAELTQAYYAQYIESERSHWWFRGRERVLRTVVPPGVRLPQRGLVMDVGSGPGGPARSLFPEAYLLGVDLSPMALQAYAQINGRLVADAGRLPCRTHSVAAIGAFDVLEHLPDDAAALAEWRRVLVPGGWLLVTVPAYAALWSRHDEANGHHRRYRRSALRRVLAAAGFRLTRITYFNMFLLPGVAAVRWTERVLRGKRPPVIAEGEGGLDCGLRFPAWIERGLEGAMSLESAWLRRRDLPAGLSICAVAQAPSVSKETGPA